MGHNARKNYLLPEERINKETFDYSLIEQIRWRLEKRNIDSKTGIAAIEVRKQIYKDVDIKLKEITRPLTMKEMDDQFDKEMIKLKRKKNKN